MSELRWEPWAAIRLVLATIRRATATVFGSAHLLGEAFFVGTLECLEWRSPPTLLADGPHDPEGDISGPSCHERISS